RDVAFDSYASNLVPGDTALCHDIDFGRHSCGDVFVRDRVARTTRRVSVSTAGAQAKGDSLGPAIGADGRYVAFESNASNLAPGLTGHVSQIFVRDLETRTTTLVSVGRR